MIKDTFFSMPRFVNLCRKDMVENWKTNALRIALMYGVMAIALLWASYLEYDHRTVLTDDKTMWQFALVLFMCCLWGFGCLNASFIMEKMKSKTSRLSMLMTPATLFEKYFSRWLLSTVVFLVIFLIAFWLADYTRVLIYTLAYPDLKGIAPLSFSCFVGDDTEHFTLCRTVEAFIGVISAYFFTQSCFVMGGSVWPKNAFLKTFVAVAIIAVVYGLFAAWMSEFLNNRSSQFVLNKIDLTLVASVFCFSFALFNWILAYFRLKESEIINRM